MSTDRRRFLKLPSTGAAAAAFPSGIARALEIPAHSRTGTIADVEHIVFMMQENRSFDHYFGTMRGVRGFGDPRAMRLPSGDTVWQQPHEAGHVVPFHPPAAGLGLTFLKDLPHDWTSTQHARNQGHYDRWVPNKGALTMAYLTRSDIPFHYALADAFTVCDAYHCSLLGPTSPNRYHMWTGWVGNNGQGAGPVVDNETGPLDWTTYPERLEKAGVSWKVYQDWGTGLGPTADWGEAKDPYIGNYGDNALLYFAQYENAEPGSPLHERAKTGTRTAAGGSLFAEFAADVKASRLPQVSWVVAPEAYTEHPNWPANYGAWYISQVLDALIANPEVWSKTVFFLMYDENDGFFDHMAPVVPPETRARGISTVPTTHEIFPGSQHYPSGPYGLGVRVPMVVISPWSKGGWVNSEVFDHTSLIRFVEQRFGVKEPNITPWRRAVTGDLTSAFDFKTPNTATVSLPNTVAYLPPDNVRHPDYAPTPPVEQVMPTQEAGTRPARALPYEPHTHARIDDATGVVELQFRNASVAATVFQVRSGDGRSGPWAYTVGANAELNDWFPITSQGKNGYDLSVYGPNGFFRAFKGGIAPTEAAKLTVEVKYDAGECGIELHLKNTGKDTCALTIKNGYTQQTWMHLLHAGQSITRSWQLGETFGWYDLTVEIGADARYRQQIAGHVETGHDSLTDPAIGRA